MVIIASKEILSKNDYANSARNYCEAIINNTKDGDWALRYFAAQTYIDLADRTEDQSYLEKAYSIARRNVNNLLDEQYEVVDNYPMPGFNFLLKAEYSFRKLLNL